MKAVGTVARGIRAPLIKTGDDIAQIVVDSILTASKEEGFQLKDMDVAGVTEAVVARAGKLRELRANRRRYQGQIPGWNSCDHVPDIIEKPFR